MMTKAQLTRAIIMKTQRMVIEDTRDLSKECGGGFIERYPTNRLDWVVDDARYCFGGSGRTWLDTRQELIEGIWKHLNGLPVQKGKRQICDVCNRQFMQVNRTHRFCSKACSDAFWHRGGSLETRRKSVERQAQA